MSRPFSVRLVLITVPGPDLVAGTKAALEGADHRVAVQLRDKAAPARELSELARALLPAVRACGAALLINDRVDVAKAVGADGVHLPESGLSVQDARAVLGPAPWIGRSCHDAVGLEQAERAGASYATLSPIGDVPGKGAALGVEGFCSAGAMPVLALGGLDPSWVPALIERGAHGVAVRRAVFSAEDPGAAVAALLARLPAL